FRSRLTARLIMKCGPTLRVTEPCIATLVFAAASGATASQKGRAAVSTGLSYCSFRDHLCSPMDQRIAHACGADVHGGKIGFEGKIDSKSADGSLWVTL